MGNAQTPSASCILEANVAEWLVPFQYCGKYYLVKPDPPNPVVIDDCSPSDERFARVHDKGACILRLYRVDGAYGGHALSWPGLINLQMVPNQLFIRRKAIKMQVLLSSYSRDCFFLSSGTERVAKFIGTWLMSPFTELRKLSSHLTPSLGNCTNKSLCPLFISVDLSICNSINGDRHDMSAKLYN